MIRETGYDVRAAVRRRADDLPEAVDQVIVGDLSRELDWRTALVDIGVVVHLAARVHVMRDDAADALEAYRAVNVGGTMALAQQAADAGVGRFVFVSSVKVNGECGTYTESDLPAPVDPYGISKYEAETQLRQLAAETRMAVVVIRPPLVYGPGVKANFRALIHAVEKGVPLPLGLVRNRRSMVALGNLADFIATCAAHPAAANETFFVSDSEDLSTVDLIRRLARVLGRPARLLPVPEWLLSAAAAAIGGRQIAQRLLGSLQVDVSKARTRLGWTPPLSVDEGLQLAVVSPRLK